MAEVTRDLLRLIGVIPQVGGTSSLAQASDLRLEAVRVDHLANVRKSGTQACDVVRKVQFIHVVYQTTREAFAACGCAARAVLEASPSGHIIDGDEHNRKTL